MKVNKNNKNSRGKWLFIIFLLQGILGFVVLSQYAGEGVADWHVTRLTVLIYAIINLAGIIGIKFFVELLEKEMKYQQLLMELQKSDEVLVSLRAHKHDFFNHLQVIMGLAQLEKTDRIVSYVQSISQNVSQSYDIANIHMPEIAIVLMQKLGEASHAGICVETQIDTTCEGLRGEGITYAQILFNLLDNAIYELNHVVDAEKYLCVEIKEETAYYEFKIYNNLPIIPQKHIKSLFEQGFTTKKGNHDGLGLWNVQKLVRSYQGFITVHSTPEEGTTFHVVFPK